MSVGAYNTGICLRISGRRQAHHTRMVLLPCNSHQWAKASSLSRIHDHTQTHYTRQDSFGRAISPTQRPPPDNTRHTTLTRERHPCPRWDSNPQSQQSSGRRPTHQAARPLGSVSYGIEDQIIKCQSTCPEEYPDVILRHLLSQIQCHIVQFCMIYSVQIGARYQDREVGQIACPCDSESFENAPVNRSFQTGLMRSFGASSYVRHVRTGNRHTHTHTHTRAQTQTHTHTHTHTLKHLDGLAT